MNTPAEIFPPLLTEKQACVYLGLSRTSLYRMRTLGQLPYVNLAREGKPIIRFRRIDLDNWITAGLKNPLASA